MLTQSKDGVDTAGKVYNYFWKKFDFRGGRTLSNVQEDHAYCKDPVKSMNQTFLLFHMGDAYFFFNELVKVQATTYAENDVFLQYQMNKRKKERFYGRAYVAAAVVPYMVSLLRTKSIPYKLLVGYLLYTCLDALYDMGIYTYFFLHGPTYMRKVLELPAKENFSSI